MAAVLAYQSELWYTGSLVLLPQLKVSKKKIHT